MSRVGGWKVEARDSSLRFDPASSTVTGTPDRTRLAAATRPTGPAPAMKTRSSIATVGPPSSLDQRNARIGDDVMILLDLVGDEGSGPIQRKPHGLGALQLELF